LPPIRRDLIHRSRYLVPNSIVVTQGCPHHCDFCYKDAFFEGGKSFYIQTVDAALGEITRLPGRHVYFLDDHLFGNRRFAEGLFDGYRHAYRDFYRWSALWRGAATKDSTGDCLRHLAYAGGWKKFERVWNLLIGTRAVLGALPLLETALAGFGTRPGDSTGGRRRSVVGRGRASHDAVTSAGSRV
jgi:hypothetical protein